MATINPYLNFSGNTEEAFNFYKSVFGGEFLVLQRFKDTPEADKLPEADRDKIMHVSLPIGNGNILMATDALESMGQKLVVGTFCTNGTRKIGHHSKINVRKHRVAALFIQMIRYLLIFFSPLRRFVPLRKTTTLCCGLTGKITPNYFQLF